MVLFMNGLTRSREFTAVNALIPDLDQTRMSGADAMFSMLQRMGKTMGVAGAAIYPAHRIGPRIR